MRPDVDSPTPRKRPSKREITREIKQEIKQEVKQEVKQEATPAFPALSITLLITTLPKRPRVVSSEFSTPRPAIKKSTTISLQRNERGRWVKRAEAEGEGEGEAEKPID
jgi:hypothetical protein